MTTFLLLIIYFAFISLGLPDSMLGAAWPTMQPELGLPISGAGLISLIISAGTILSSILSGNMIRRLGVGRLTLLSVLMTAIALFGFSLSNNYWLLCLLAVPLGLGAGAVDAALNHFVALHHAARHMNWLHSFWGIGATAGPIIMALMLTRTAAWQNGYRVVSLIQFALVALLFSSLPLWKSFPEPDPEASAGAAPSAGAAQKFWAIPGIKPALAGFFCYCALEATAGLWGATYLVQEKGVSKQTAAGWISTYYFGITLGRIVNGFLSNRWSSQTLIRLGMGLIAAGVLVLFASPGGLLDLLGFVLIGLGCAPIFPSMLHETPTRFGRENSSSLMGIQMASAYTGTTLVPPLVGVISAAIGMAAYPGFLLLLLAGMVLANETAHTLVTRPS